MPAADPHPPSADLADLTVESLIRQLDNGVLTSRAATTGLLSRIAGVDAPGTATQLRSVLRTSDDAEDAAARSDAERTAGRLSGRLHGVPVLVKDNIEAVGLPGSAGSLALADRTVAVDSTVVSRLRAAGAIVIGSTNLSEWANFRSPRSVSGWSGLGGLTGNPWALDRSAGGSSSGSGAAVAAGLAPVAIGTETNGSITCPAALNGVVGLKPTVGSIPTDGIVPISASQDVPGPIARTVRDAAVVFEVLSGRTDALAACRPEAAASVRVGVAAAWLSGHAATDAVFASAVDALTPHVSAVRSAAIPFTDHAVHDDQVTVLLGEILDDMNTYLAARPGAGVRSLAEVVAFNARHAQQELAAFGQEYFEQALGVGGRESEAYRAARRRNVDWARDTCMGPALAEGIDLIVAPAYQPAWKSDLTHGDQLSGGGAICTPAAILGWPILTVPMGLVDGLPVGFSLVGPAGSEATLLAVGHALESALGLAGSGALRPAWRPAMRG